MLSKQLSEENNHFLWIFIKICGNDKKNCSVFFTAFFLVQYCE